jgi:hypothetical protein
LLEIGFVKKCYLYYSLKKLISILFFSIYLLSVTEAHQFLKVPLIFQHFAEHSSADNHINFLQFLGMHYFNGDPQDGDYERDMKLPFKTSSDCVASVVSVTVPDTYFIIPPIELPLAKNEFFNRNDFFIPREILSNIFQPPKAS